MIDTTSPIRLFDREVTHLSSESISSTVGIISATFSPSRRFSGYEHTPVSSVSAPGRVPQDSLTGRSYKVLLLNRSGVCGYHAATLANTEPCTESDPQNPSEYVNFHAFAANLYERRIFRADPTWAIWAQREAHEIGRKEHGSVRDGYVLAAAQWIS